MRRIVFVDGLDAAKRRRALTVAEGWGVRATLVAPRTYHLDGQMVDAVVRALVRLELIETAKAGEA